MENAKNIFDDCEPYRPEADLVIPMNFDEGEVFDLLDSEGVSFDAHRSRGYFLPTLKAHNEEFFGVDGVRRFIEYRRLGLFALEGSSPADLPKS